ncbi:outer membrane protein [Granulicella aggregans]|uniref:Outer membrane protein n=1 Tax=Granulicella aggregans TaxID=474949 RepID=A0A7W7ZER8_9BACT|nr:OmpH family outer membrane protein [Granulicella aggregans]MBB5058274.1 outer membrane protein [Granulicella aggregans]
MNRTLAIVSALGAGLLAVSAPAQTPAAAPAAAPTAPAPVVPQAIPAKIALIAFEQSVFATNEGQVAVQGVQKKYEPKKSQIDTLAQEVDSLKKQLQALPATTTDEDRASRLKNIDTKEKQLNRDAEDAQTAYNADLQEAYGKMAQKVNATMRKYVQDNGYTLLLDVSGQQNPVLWALPTTDVTEAVINAYNTASGVAAPPPAAPSATRPRPAAGAAKAPAAAPKKQ